MNVTLIIPALNEAACIGPLLAELPRGLVQEVLVVDNGSTDDTAGAARRAGARVISEPRRGYGYACAAGVAMANAELLAFMDGDGSFIPAELGTLLAPIIAGSAEMVLGTRLRGSMAAGAMPPHQHFGNQLVARLMYLFYGLRLTDLGPFRVVRRDLLSTLDMREMTYGWPVEMIVKAARRQARIVEVPISYRPRLAGQSKVGGTVRGTLLATYRILRTTLRYAAG
ncbi:MAG TPA: glycosyltransferase family 2 protein [Roseiflexaceae bacterium]|nr:glycosyltransferase family 2 protein [Roseiflexaceae bacterium]